MRQGIKLDEAKVKEISANIQNMLDNVELRKGDQKINVENMTKLTEAMLWGAGIQATGKKLPTAYTKNLARFGSK